ncbi:putative long-chain-fatty-acid--CoA ligase [Rosa chinensis]|uniref:Putative long-chain-fatty-acid--CoA ligase n=1 Tax=Rosa chinensis TaxID=74649 RepID=A0A2P6PN95_ROSCH|nr:putative long-chain-fatty-acid--CoA ligase [Rosa chinensis]
MGYLSGGDIGEWQPNGAMKVIDRKKNIFKLSQGEYVAVERIESKYLQCPLITSIWVYGNTFKSFLVAWLFLTERPCRTGQLSII